MESMEGLVVETELSARGPLDGRFFLKAHAELSLHLTEREFEKVIKKTLYTYLWIFLEPR
jgi:hypothetical protein